MTLPTAESRGRNTFTGRKTTRTSSSVLICYLRILPETVMMESESQNNYDTAMVGVGVLMM